MAFQRTDDSFARYGATIDGARRVLMLTKGNSRTWSASFTFERAAEDRLTLDGMMDGHAIRMRLSLVGRDAHPLLNSRFRWVRPPD
jgi:ureidoglycolate hydrolase